MGFACSSGEGVEWSLSVACFLMVVDVADDEGIFAFGADGEAGYVCFRGSVGFGWLVGFGGYFGADVGTEEGFGGEGGCAYMAAEIFCLF